MARTLTAAYLTALASDTIRGCHLLEAVFDAQTYYLTDAYTQVTWGGNDYIALGHLLEFDAIEETSKVQVNDTEISLSGVDQTYLSVFLSQDYVNRKIRIYQALFDSNWTLIVDPVKLFEGRMDLPTIVDDPDAGTSVIKIRAVNQWSDFDRVQGRRTNNGSQQAYFSNDVGFDYASELQKEVVWGRRINGAIPIDN